MKNVFVLQHVPAENLGTIADTLAAAGASPRYVQPFAGQTIPREMAGAAGLIVMGGPMGVYEQSIYPFLSAEMRLIELALLAEKPILGVCLGSQLLAAVLGAPVNRGERKEIGWHPVYLTDSAGADSLWRGVESPFTAYHWHGDIFQLPHGAVGLASSELTAHQAFRYGSRAYGFLFHMEVTDAIIADMVGAFDDELEEAGLSGSEIVQQSALHLAHLQDVGSTVFGRWAGLL